MRQTSMPINARSRRNARRSSRLRPGRQRSATALAAFARDLAAAKAAYEKYTQAQVKPGSVGLAEAREASHRVFVDLRNRGQAAYGTTKEGEGSNFADGQEAVEVHYINDDIVETRRTLVR